MSVPSIRYYCRNCKFDRTYQTEEEVPSRCPQCQADSKFIIPHVHLPMEAASPDELNGVRVRMQLEEHRFEKKFQATIVGHKPHPSYKTSRLPLYILRVDQKTVKSLDEKEHLLFHPQGVIDFDKGSILGSLMKKYHTFDCKPSMEDLLLNPNCLFSGLIGRVYAPKDPFTPSPEAAVLDISLISYGKIFPPRDLSHSFFNRLLPTRQAKMEQG